MAVDRLTSMLLRGAELVFAAIVAGVNGNYLDKSHASSWDLGRFIYAEVVAALSMLFALLWLFPFSKGFTFWHMDIIISLCWWAVFGLLVNLLGDSCGHIFDWRNVSPRGDQCGKFKADIAFSFLSALLWLVSALLGIFWVRKHRNEHQGSRVDPSHGTHHRHGWRRRGPSRV